MTFCGDRCPGGDSASAGGEEAARVEVFRGRETAGAGNGRKVAKQCRVGLMSGDE